MENAYDKAVCSDCNKALISTVISANCYFFKCDNCGAEFHGTAMSQLQTIAETVFQKLRPLHVAQMAEIKKLTATKE